MTTIDGIGGPGGTGGPRQPGQPGKPGSPDPTRKQDPAEEIRGDRLDLSADRRRVADLAEAAGRLPEVRAEKVEALRRVIAEGDYEPDLRIVARAILEFEGGLPD